LKTLFKVVLHTELERKLPQVLLERIDKAEQIEYPNERKTKMGFLDFILRKWFCNPFSDDGKPPNNHNLCCKWLYVCLCIWSLALLRLHWRINFDYEVHVITYLINNGSVSAVWFIFAVIINEIWLFFYRFYQ